MAETIFTRFTILRNLINSNVTAKVLSNVTQHMKLNVRYSATRGNEISKSLDLDDIPNSKMDIVMKKYLERVRSHENYIKKEIAEYEIGKRHLANIMGVDPQRFTQHDINVAIEYLFPSGLYEKRARPMMRHPTEIIPPAKEAEFDKSGRPFHFLFYTSNPKYYEILYNISEQYLMLNKLADHMKTHASEILDDIDSTWMTKKDIESLLKHNISDEDYNYLIISLERLIKHPLSQYAKGFIMQYRNKLSNVSLTKDLLPILNDAPDGRPYVLVKNCKRKNARGTVIVRSRGSGKITINGESISYFRDMQCREQVIFPLIFTNMADKVDIEANVTGGGPTGQSGAIRWGIAWGLRNFVTEEVMNQMRLAGLLTRDWRRRERKKYGQEGARRKFTWKKR